MAARRQTTAARPVEAVAVTFYRHTDGCERKPDVHVRVQVCGWVG